MDKKLIIVASGTVFQGVQIGSVVSFCDKSENIDCSGTVVKLDGDRVTIEFEFDDIGARLVERYFGIDSDD